jgi:PST family polysaccharide transporter
MGGAQLIRIAVGLLKIKFVAVLLGPVGVGMVGLYLSLIQTASAIASLGIGNVGTRQIATAHSEGGDAAVGRSRRALFWGTLGLAVIGTFLFWLASTWIARVILMDVSRATDVAWLSLGVGLTVAAGGQGALLTGLRRIGDLALVNAGGGIIGAALGVAALSLWGAQGLVAMVLIAPVVTFLLGHLYVARLGQPTGSPVPLPAMASEWRVMAALGFAFMLSGLVTTLGHLAVRALVQREAGPDALGHFQAASAIGMTYLGFIVGAMGTDYYPRLTVAIQDHVRATRLVNEQTEVALLLCAPLLLAMLGLAPWVIKLLYTEEFAPAAEILRWQFMGYILKVMSWPLGFILLATGSGKTFIVTESLAMAVFLFGAMQLIPLFGVNGTGIAFLAMYVVYLPLVWWLGGRQIGFCWTQAVKLQALTLMTAVVLVNIIARWSTASAAALGLALAVSMGLWALSRLSAMTEVGGWLGQIGKIGDRIRKWIVRPR